MTTTFGEVVRTVVFLAVVGALSAVLGFAIGYIGAAIVSVFL